ncbi:MAG: type II toxin-antitoxin system VapC family toxin [Cyanobacteria bacterium]|nr:type II toxin-antitoxin system VapC family toxin [Cyanobacteria bacterium CG_2015-16_32_12]NCO79645.1 type II toxin-antitoxin system VapC family toxin [Cyanobacteria bacterium CG_2015-22_32_23]NCQ05832.1 type II toxin-antitoxin system VapC family toxin [Cyanobacteria bacterium CG_2015-09_32_10]NCQ43281.1 type II toxin-antitoxin system VapC family toxin [Cyanobacteria bacterium CG_2015-04_32_10]
MSNSSLVYLLDTNVCIVYLKGKAERVKTCLDGLRREQIAVCSVVKGELFYGAIGSNNPQKALNLQRAFLSQFVSLPFDDSCAEVYGKIRRNLASQGKPIGGNDLLIASIALANNLVLVTHNVREFSRVEDLQVEDWEE